MYSEMDEQALAKACLSGDRLAQDELYNRYAARLYTLCKRYSGNAQEAQDLLHDTFIKAFNSMRYFTPRGEGSLYGWLCRIAINLSINHVRRHRWRFIMLDSAPGDYTEELTEEDAVRVPEDKLLEMISGLPDSRRAVFNLYCIEGYSHKEIGEMLGISEKGSSGILYKARMQLVEAIKRYLKNQE